MSVKRRKKPPLTPPVEGELGNHIPYWAAYLAERCLILLLSHYVTANCSPALRGAPRSGEGLKQRSTKFFNSKEIFTFRRICNPLVTRLQLNSLPNSISGGTAFNSTPQSCKNMTVDPAKMSSRYAVKLVRQCL